MNEITRVIDGVNEIVTTIASAVEEQATTTRDIAGNVTRASQGIQVVNGNIVQNTSVANNIAQEIQSVNSAADEMAASGSRLNTNALDMQQLAQRLNQIVSQFRIAETKD
jgi:methyl-accepting chemotaxis protein